MEAPGACKSGRGLPVRVPDDAVSEKWKSMETSTASPDEIVKQRGKGVLGNRWGTCAGV